MADGGSLSVGRMFRRNLVLVMPADQFATRSEAGEVLGLGRFWVNMLVTSGSLIPAATKPAPLRDDEIGVTRASLDAQIPWWAAATAERRRRRKLRLLARII